MTCEGNHLPAQLHLALAQSGGVQIELIQPAGGKSLYQEFLDQGRQGIHHIGFLTNDYEGALNRAETQGLTFLMKGQSGDMRFSYFEADRSLPLIELIDAEDSFCMLHKKVAEASVGWTGADPIRDFAGLFKE